MYSHDAFGLGNIRRMLSICEHLLDSIENVSILVISGSPIMHSFRLPVGLDYIKLPCLNRGETGELKVKYLGTDFYQTVKLRSDLILAAVRNFQPDILLVDKKPHGMSGELKSSVEYLRSNHPRTKLVLLLRDILDRAEVVIPDWVKNGYQASIETEYDQVLVVGMPEVFDISKEYQFSDAMVEKVKFCGYIGRPDGQKTPEMIHQDLNLLPGQKLVLVTPGGGEDGYQLVSNYLRGLSLLPKTDLIKTLIFTGPEMPLKERESLLKLSRLYPHIILEEFSDDMMSYINAAHAVVAMGGYNTICEILSAATPAVIIPRIKPAQEQLIRAIRMEELGLFITLHPNQITPQILIRSVLQQIQGKAMKPSLTLDLGALPRISEYLIQLSKSISSSVIDLSPTISSGHTIESLLAAIDRELKQPYQLRGSCEEQNYHVTQFTQKLETLLCLNPSSAT